MINKSGAVNWKALIVIVLFAGAIAFGVRQFRSSWHERPPAAFDFKRRNSPLSSETRTQLGALVKEARRVAGSQYLTVTSLEFLQLTNGDPPDTFWQSDQLKNAGFEPLGNFERPLYVEEAKLIGYYTLDGVPVAFTVKHDPKNDKRLSVTIHLDPPVTKGEMQVVLRAERRDHNPKRDQDGNFVVNMGDGNPNQRGLRARGVQLPAGASVIAIVPDDSSTLTGGALPLVGWFCSDLETKLPLSVTYKL